MGTLNAQLNRFSAIETILYVNQNLANVVWILREEGTEICKMQR